MYDPPNPNDMATQVTPWHDFEVILAELNTMTVNSLKGVITGLVEESRVNMWKVGGKSALQKRIVRALRGLQADGKVDKWIRARAVILQVSSGLAYDHATLSRFMNTPNNSSSGGNTTTPNDSSPYHASSAPYYASYRRAAIGDTGPPKYTAEHIGPKWRYSPFYRIDQAVSSVQECPESTSSTDRRSSRFNFYLNADHLTKLGSRSSKYQLRLYCTTSQYWIRLGTSFRNTLCPVEFPPTCEVRVNDRLLTANFRGFNKNVGTTPPADVTDLCDRGVPGVGNALEMTYANSNQATGNNKFYLVVNLVEVMSVDEFVKRLRRRFQPMGQVIASIKARQVDDDEVEVGPSKLSLRDPLTYTRIKLPCRASGCVHIGCFDARCWYAMMEQTPTWLCPICDRVLDPDELMIDGFIADILAKVHDDVNDVMIEPDMEWHTEDRTAGSVPWMQKYGVMESGRAAILPPSKAPSGPSTIIIGDSSESEEEEERRELSPQVAPALQPLRPAAPDVIDLTLSNSDDDYMTGHQSERPHSNTNGYYYRSVAAGSFSTNLTRPTTSVPSPALKESYVNRTDSNGLPRPRNRPSILIGNAKHDLSGPFAGNPWFFWSPEKVVARTVKRQSKVYRKRRTTEHLSDIVTLFTKIAFLLFSIYSLLVCPKDVGMESPVCRGIDRYKKSIVDPYILPPLRAAASHPAIAPRIEQARPYVDHAVEVVKTRYHIVHDQVVVATEPYMILARKQYNAKARPQIRLMQYTMQRYQRQAQPYVDLAKAETLQAWHRAEVYVLPILLKLEQTPTLLKTLIAEPLEDGKERSVDLQLKKIVDKVHEMSASAAEKNTPGGTSTTTGKVIFHSSSFVASSISIIKATSPTIEKAPAPTVPEPVPEETAQTGIVEALPTPSPRTPGTATSESTMDPLDMPLINPNYDEDVEDIEFFEDLKKR